MSSGSSSSLTADSVNRTSIHSLHRNSLHSLHASASSQDPSVSKTSLELRALDAATTDPEDLSPYPRTAWYNRVQTRIAARHPRFYARASRVLLYCRGPRPKVDLPNPRPWLDIDFHYRGINVVLPIESTILRTTRLLRNPWLFVLLAVAYIIALAFFSTAQSFLTPADDYITCTSVYWVSNAGCGLNGADCGPFSDSTFDFRCPAQCSSVVLENPRTVGNEQVDLVPLIVGGGDVNRTYRGDTFICAAALQAGLISDSRGGCASLSLIGNYTNFLPFSAHGLTSIGFPTVFPLSWQFNDHTSLTSCADNRDAALAMNILVTFILFVVLRPKPIVLFWCLVCIGYWHVTLFSQPQSNPPPLDVAFQTFLPVLFIAYAFWRLAFRFTLPAFAKLPLESAIWYLATFWAGVLTNITLDKIPIETLTGASIQKEKGAITALVIIVIVVAAIVINQVRIIRKTGYLPKYLAWHIAGALTAVVLACLPGLVFRLHHYIIAMALMPGTGFPTRPSAVYQGFLLGLFLNGAAAFGLDSILQTAAELVQDAPLGTTLPAFVTNSTNFNSSIPFVNQTIFWEPLPSGWDGFSLIVDDVERYVGTALNFSLAAFDATLPHFFRLALTSSGNLGDFTMSATLFPNGTWIDPAPGSST
ncbi:hypothetical protein BT96DRAFT_970895 [Gymnopus androsaceus JB14]|uniref:LCCL domain-containing protein n=1 Tax=Gymnopus androsaceus JB14 TaxID=1447944 RepID=A0A6A4IE29_9AGAR|nr:hypothetical protein BT96DRAFT_970895 [Gymnopus androsaceus JB14]